MNIIRFFSVVLILCSVAFLTGCGITLESRTAIAEDKIREDPEFRQMDDICRSIPHPSGSEYIGKARMFNSVRLSFYYSTGKSNPELKEHFQEYFAQSEWQEVNPKYNDLAYKKGGVEVDVHFTRDSSVSYTVYCGKIRSSSAE